MTDPSYLSILKNLGWEDDNNRDVRLMPSEEEETTGVAPLQINTNTEAIASRKSKSEIQRELLGLKRKSLALRRQGEAEAAEEVLKMAKVLEVQLAETEAPMHTEVPSESKDLMENVSNNLSVENSDSSFQLDSKSSRTVEKSSGAGLATVGKANDIDGANEQRDIHASRFVQANEAQNDGNSLQQDVLVHKRRALALKREGKLAEAKEELRQAKLLEKRMEEDKSQEMNDSEPATESSEFLGSNVSSIGKKEASPSSGSKSISGRDRFKMQQECLGHKRQALKLRREGRTAEADAELELAKALEAQLEESGAHDSSSSSAAEPTSDPMVENFLDPQLLSALSAIGIRDTTLSAPGPDEVPESKNVDKSVEERAELEEQIKAERMKAINFKRSGKQAEALAALRRAKLFEKKLNSLNAAE